MIVSFRKHLENLSHKDVQHNDNNKINEFIDHVPFQFNEYIVQMEQRIQGICQQLTEMCSNETITQANRNITFEPFSPKADNISRTNISPSKYKTMEPTNTRGSNVSTEIKNKIEILYHPKKMDGVKSSKEVRRLQLIKEFIETEFSHIKQLTLLNDVFFKRILDKNLLKPDEMELIFPNLPDLLSTHKNFLNQLVESVETNQLSRISFFFRMMFSSRSLTNSSNFEDICKKFCQNQIYALKKLKKWLLSNHELAKIFQLAEQVPELERRKFGDIYACSHQRLTKYQLFLEQIKQFTPPLNSDFNNIKMALTGCKEIIHNINSCIEECENLNMLRKIKKNLKIESGDHSFLLKEFSFGDDKLIFQNRIHLEVEPEKYTKMELVLTDRQIVLFSCEKSKFILKLLKLYTAKNHIVPFHRIEQILKLTSNERDFRIIYVILETDRVSPPHIQTLVFPSVMNSEKFIKTINDSFQNSTSLEGSPISIGEKTRYHREDIQRCNSGHAYKTHRRKPSKLSSLMNALKIGHSESHSDKRNNEHKNDLVNDSPYEMINFSNFENFAVLKLDSNETITTAVKQMQNSAPQNTPLENISKCVHLLKKTNYMEDLDTMKKVIQAITVTLESSVKKIRSWDNKIPIKMDSINSTKSTKTTSSNTNSLQEVSSENFQNDPNNYTNSYMDNYQNYDKDDDDQLNETRL